MYERYYQGIYSRLKGEEMDLTPEEYKVKTKRLEGIEKTEKNCLIMELREKVNELVEGYNEIMKRLNDSSDENS